MDVWRDGALAAKGGAAFLGVSEATFRTLAKQQRWPRKRVLAKVVYPRAALVAFLSGCPDAVAK